MKSFLAIIISLFFLSCQKEHNLGEDYKSFIGTWINCEGDIDVKCIFTKDGKFEKHSLLSRFFKKKIKGIDLGGITTSNIRKLKIIYKDVSGNLYFNNNLDTMFYFDELYINNHYYDYTKSIRLIKVQ